MLLHELAHVARYDCLTQMLAAAGLRALLVPSRVWWVARRFRVERELACDDRVIAAGTQAREYAGHLLEIAYSSGGRRAPALALSMARPRQLEGRMLAALDDARNRRRSGARVRRAAAAARGRRAAGRGDRHADPGLAPGGPGARPRRGAVAAPAAGQDAVLAPHLEGRRRG